MTTFRKRAFRNRRQRLSKRSMTCEQPPRKGGILEALRRSPLVGADLDLKRPGDQGRKVAL
jgi:hypothetical protein